MGLLLGEESTVSEIWHDQDGMENSRQKRRAIWVSVDRELTLVQVSVSGYIVLISGQVTAHLVQAPIMTLLILPEVSFCPSSLTMWYS
jgi:hypothetical protein